MSSEWTVARIRDIADVFDGPHATPTKIKHGPIFLSISSLSNGKLDLAKSAHISEVDFKKWTRRVTPRKDDVVFSYETRLGEAAIIPEGLRCCLGRRLGLMRLKTDDVIPQYLLYYYLGAEFQEQIKVKTIHGSTVERLSLTEFPEFEIKYPSLESQRKVCALLGGVDALVQSYLLQNVSLEALAQTLFRSWFVNFDPVHAKAAGNEPEAMSAELAALFPSEFENNELGKLPKGWGSTNLGAVADFIKGRSYKSEELQPSSVALVTLKSFHRGGGFRLDGFKPYVGKFKDNQVVTPGECIVALTDVTQNAEVIGRPAMVYPSEFKTIASLDVGILRPKSEEVTKEFLYCLLREQRYIAHILGFTTGTTVLHLAKDGVPSYRFALPTPVVVKKFSEVASPLFKTIEVNILLANKLTCLRDHLLPRLISGKLCIEDAEASVAEIASGLEIEPV